MRPGASQVGLWDENGYQKPEWSDATRLDQLS